MSVNELRQGDIIKINFDPRTGHQQAGYRPALVLSCGLFNRTVNQMPVLCPVTNTKKSFPFHIPLDGRTKTTGVVMCEQLKATDIMERGYIFIERIPDDLLRRVLNIVKQVFDFDEEPDEDYNQDE